MKRFAIVASIGIIAGIIPLLSWSVRLYQDVKNFDNLLSQFQAFKGGEITFEQFPVAYKLAVLSAGYAQNIKKDIEPIYPIIDLLDTLPVIGTYLQQIQPIVDYSTNLTRAGSVLAQVISPLWLGNTDFSHGISPLQRFVYLANENESNILLAESSLEKAIAAQKMIDPLLIPQKYRGDFALVNSLLPKAELVINILQTLPRLLGTSEAETYLIMVQNRDELRASGGFVSAFGLLRLDEGRISILEIEDSTQMDYVKEIRNPPAPLGSIMEANYLVARDANWSPDFPTAAKETQEMYYLSTDIPTDGVIAFDQGLIIALLDVLGPISVPDGDSINSSNIEGRMIQYKQEAIQAGNLKGRKEFLAMLAPYLVEKIYSVHEPAAQYRLLKLIVEMIEAGHLLVYLNDPDSQNLLSQIHLDGAVTPGGGDYIMLVDSNLGISKVDLFVTRSLTYDVDLEDPQKPHATIQMTYSLPKEGNEPCHQGVSHDAQSTIDGYYFVRCYWNYWRVLVLNNNTPVSASFDPVPQEYFETQKGWDNGVDAEEGEEGTLVLGGLVVVPQMQSRQVTLNIELPEWVIYEEEGNLVYQLRIQKQAGIRFLPVDIRVISPQGYFIRELSKGWSFNPDNNRYFWKGNLTKTRDFQLKFIHH